MDTLKVALALAERLDLWCELSERVEYVEFERSYSALYRGQRYREGARTYYEMSEMHSLFREKLHY